MATPTRESEPQRSSSTGGESTGTSLAGTSPSATSVTQGQSTASVVPPAENLQALEIGWGICAAISWLAFFAMGILLPANEAMMRFWGAELPGFFEAIGWGLIAITAYAVTNLLFLICSASVLGCMAQRWQVSSGIRRMSAQGRVFGTRRVYASAILRGFFLYLLIIGGFFIVATYENLAQVKFDQYIRLAGVASVLGFVSGYDPNVFVQFLHRVIEATVPREPTEEEAASHMGIPESQEEVRRKEESL